MRIGSKTRLDTLFDMVVENGEVVLAHAETVWVLLSGSDTLGTSSRNEEEVFILYIEKCRVVRY